MNRLNEDDVLLTVDFRPQAKSGLAPRLGFAGYFGVSPTSEIAAASMALQFRGGSIVTLKSNNHRPLTLLLCTAPSERASLEARLAQRSEIVDVQNIVDALCLATFSFAGFLIDLDASRIHVITDPLNSRRVFYARHATGWHLGTAFTRQVVRTHGPSTQGVAWFLATGSVPNNKTVVADIMLLPQRAITSLSAKGFVSEQYRLPLETGMWPSQRLRRREQSRVLVDLLSEACKKALQLTVLPKLALSGGYDSAAIAAILRYRCDVRDLECLSFSIAPESVSDNSDAAVAARTAKQLGYKHAVVPSYDGDLPNIVKSSADMALGLAGVHTEFAVWTAICEHTRENLRPSLVIGDECFGWINCRLRCTEDVLHSVYVWIPSASEWTNVGFSSEWAAAVSSAMKTEAYSLVSPGRGRTLLHAQKDALYRAHRLPNVILPLRHFYARSFVDITAPLLDARVLAFVESLPGEERIGKRFFAEAVSKAFPEVFRIRRATQPEAQPNWHGEVLRHRQGLRRLLMDGSSVLDRLISEATREKVFHTLTSPKGVSHPASIVYRRLADVVGPTKIGGIMRGLRVPPRPRMLTASILLRLACLREVFMLN